MEILNSFFILEAKKENNSFYVSNTDPIIWTSEIKNSKCYSTEDRASGDILRDYNNYHAIKNLLDSTQIDSLFVIEIRNNLEEVGRVQIL